MSVSNRPRVSSGLSLALVLIAGLVGPWCRSAAAELRASIAPVISVRLAAGAAAPGAWTDLRGADADWLRALPASAFAITDSTLAPDAEVAAARTVVAAGRAVVADAAAGPAATAVRPVASRLRDRWQARGHLACVVRIERSSPNVVVTIDPGVRYVAGRIRLEGDDFRGRERALGRWLPRTGDPFTADDWERTVNALLTAAGEGGHPFARWLVRDVRVDLSRGAVDVTALLMTGPHVVFGAQTSDLPDGRGEAFLLRAAGLPTGRPFRESALREARARLQQRDIYEAVGLPVVHTTTSPDTVGVYWPVTPVDSPNRAAVMLGLSRAGEGEPSRMSGQVDLRLANLAGTGRRLELAWSDDGRERSHFGFGWREPLIRGTPFDASFAVDHEVEGDVYTRFRLDGRLQLPVAGAWGVEVGLGWDRSTFPTGDWTRTTRWRARGAVLRQRPNRHISGWGGVFALESASRGVQAREVEQGPAPTTPGETRQTLVEVRLNGEQWLGSVVSLAFTGALREVSGDDGEVPLSEQYRLGGARSLRGYLEDQFHGDRVASGMLELRLGRPGRSRLYTFFDVGYFRFATVDPVVPETIVTRSGTRRGFGFGLETASLGGDVSLAVGLPGTFQFDDAKLHVALLQAF